MDRGSGKRTERKFGEEALLGEGGDSKEFPGRSSPSWRALFLSVIAAIILSATATLLLGGSFGFTNADSTAGCGPGSVCAPPGVTRSAGR